MFTIVVHVFVFYAYNGQKKTCGFSGDGSEVEAHGTGVLAEARALVAQLDRSERLERSESWWMLVSLDGS